MDSPNTSNVICITDSEDDTKENEPIRIEKKNVKEKIVEKKMEEKYDMKDLFLKDCVDLFSSLGK